MLDENELERADEIFTNAAQVHAKRARALMDAVITECLKRGGYEANMVLSQLEGNLELCAAFLKVRKNAGGAEE